MQPPGPGSRQGHPWAGLSQVWATAEDLAWEGATVGSAPPGHRGPWAGVGSQASWEPAPCHRPTPTPLRAPWGPRWPGPPDSAQRPSAQVREAYLQFMVSVAAMLRKDVSLPEDSRLVQEDMAQVLKLETQLANVRPGPLGEHGGGGHTWALAITPEAPPDPPPPVPLRPRPRRKRGMTSPPCTTGWRCGSSRTSSA